MTYRLLNVESKYKMSPTTEFLPHSDERLNLKVGDIVRIMLFSGGGDETSAEGVWVTVKVSRDGRYIGDLLEALPSIPDLPVGSELPFGAEHVAHIWSEEGDHRWFDAGKLALVSKQMYETKEWPGKLLRFKPANNEYSGWIILSGKEPKGFEGDPNNFFPMRLNELVKRFPPLASILARPIGDSFRWNAEKSEYLKIQRL